MFASESIDIQWGRVSSAEIFQFLNWCVGVEFYCCRRETMPMKFWFRRLRRRMRAVTCGEWLFLYILLNLLHNIYRDFRYYGPHVHAGVIAGCNDKAAEMLNLREKGLGFRSVYSVIPSKESKEYWVYHAQVSSVHEKPVAFFSCVAHEADIDKSGLLSEGTKLFVNLYDYRGATR